MPAELGHSSGMAAGSSNSRPKRSSSDTLDSPNKKRPSNPTHADDCSAADSDDVHADDCSADSDHVIKVSELMARGPWPRPRPRQKPKPKEDPSESLMKTTAFAGRDGLGVYLNSPSSFPASRVIFHTPSFVAIHDMYPKSTVHCLLLPRSATHNRLHPFEAFEDADFLASVRHEAERLKELVAKELQRIIGKYSASDGELCAILDGEAEPDRDAEGRVVMPPGRDWAREVKVGVHARPSMNHLHVHVMSRDMHSETMKTRKHYNSFTTGFFVPLEDFPLARDDPRREQKGWPERPMVCWRCGADLPSRSKFGGVKGHMREEFEEWKKE